mgnify:CR=1 FL=1
MSEDNENRKKYTRKIDEYYRNALNRIAELEQQNKELILTLDHLVNLVKDYFSIPETKRILAKYK